MSGVMGTGMRQLLTKGPLVLLWADWDEEDDGAHNDWGNIIREGFFSAAWGGPVEYVIYSLDHGDGAIDAVGKMLLPLTMATELQHFLAKSGPYKNLRGFDRYTKALQEWTTASAALTTWGIIVSLHEEEAEMRYSYSQYYKWASKNMPRAYTEYKRGSSPEEEFKIAQEQSENFRAHMAKAYKLIDKGVDNTRSAEYQEGVLDVIKKAVRTGGRDRSSVVSSIKSRRLLHKLDDNEKASLSRSVSPEVYKTLEKHDKVLTAWANKIKYIK